MIYAAALKRTFDVVFSLIVFILVLSWLYPLLALLIKLDSPGPVCFTQLRTGRNHIPFRCFKFRTMRVNREADWKQATRHDERITAVGRFLRRTSLDELPQFVNVLIGDMSVVGPRPMMINHTRRYSQLTGDFSRRQRSKPGITGWAQVSGLRGEIRTRTVLIRRVEADLWYLQNSTFALDLKIIGLTFLNTLRGDHNAF